MKKSNKENLEATPKEKIVMCEYCNYKDHPKVIEYHIKKCNYNPKNMPKDLKNIKGIGGWLIIPVIGLIIGFVYSLFTSFYDIISIIESSDFIIFLIMRIILTPIIGYTLFLLFKKKKATIKWFIFIMWFELFLMLYVSWQFGDYTGIIPSILSNIIWTMYFFNSRRVSNTFIK